MQRNKLGSSDLSVSNVCLGCWQFNAGAKCNTWPGQDEKVSIDIVNKCLDLGVNFFDTAEAYSNHKSEEVLGKALLGRRRDVVIASKFGALKENNAAYDAVDIEKSLTESLRSLQTDYIDLYQVHQTIYMKDVKETVAELKRQQALGKIRYYAVSNFGLETMKQFHENGGVATTNQLPYNLLWRAIEYNIVDDCDKYNTDILAYSPLQQGLLTGKFSSPNEVPEGRRRTKHFSSTSTVMSRHGQAGAEQETFQTIEAIRKICGNEHTMASTALSWLVNQKRVASVVVGARTPQQMEENCKLYQLSEEKLQALNAATEKLKEIFGEDPDMWAKETRIV